jgi:hypothetical protein
MTKTSFGEYFDKQRDKIVKDMQTGKNTELYMQWREDYDKRHLLKNAIKKGIDAKERIQE